ncbi:MAG: hypothetical protein ACI4C1_08500 [Lachnospiraceae bacterium]
MSDYKMSLDDFCYYVATTAYKKVKEAEISAKVKNAEQKIQENETIQKVTSEVKTQVEKIGKKIKETDVKEQVGETINSIEGKLEQLKKANAEMSKEEKIAALEKKYQELSSEVEALWKDYMGEDGKIRKGAESAVKYVKEQIKTDHSIVDSVAEEVEPNEENEESSQKNEDGKGEDILEVLLADEEEAQEKFDDLLNHVMENEKPESADENDSMKVIDFDVDEEKSKK